MLEEKISVVMSVYNESDDWISASVESILNQTFKNFEFIIVVDSPNQRIQILLEKYRKIDERIIILQNSSNRGLVYSLNRGIKKSTGKYIARMDADDISHLDRLEKEIAELRQKKVDFIFSEIDLIDEDGEKIKIRNSKSVNASQMKKIMKYGNISNHPTWLFKREIFDSINGYRNIPNCEDQDFILRAILKGFKIHKIGESLLDYRIRSSSISRMNALDQFLTARNIRQLYKTKKLLLSMPMEYRISDKEKQKFNIAQSDFMRGLGMLGDHKFNGLVKIFLSSFKSKYMFISQIDLLKFKIIFNIL